MAADRERPAKSDYRHFIPITTRWKDNDVYGHVNNVTFYSYFDTAANLYLIKEGGLDIHSSPVIAYVVHSECDYHSPLAYPDEIFAGLRVDKLGTRSVTYGIGIFHAAEERLAAHGSFVHVFVDRAGGKPAKMPDRIRSALEAIQV